MSDLQRYAEAALAAAHAAAMVLNRHYADPSALNIEQKADRTPVTAADFDAHDAIAAVLREQCPDVLLLSEENVSEAGEQAATADRFWCVDPLDGTREFITRTAEFTVNIALIERGVAVVGAIAVPQRGQVALAVRGMGAQMHEGGKTRAMRARALADPQSPTVTVSRFHHSADLDSLLEPFAGTQKMMLGAGIKWVALADGEADLYPRLNTRMCEWDIAAGQVLIEEAGGCFLDHAGVPMTYARHADWRVRRFLAYADRAVDWFSLLGMAERD